MWNELKIVYENFDISLVFLKIEIEVFEKSIFVEMEDIYDVIEGYLNDIVMKVNVLDIFILINFWYLIISFD